jgi:hypothetical protein
VPKIEQSVLVLLDKQQSNSRRNYRKVSFWVSVLLLGISVLPNPNAEGQIQNRIWNIQAPDSSFEVAIEGTIDGFNTRKYSDESIFDVSRELRSGGIENNISLILENTGHRILRNPQVEINGKRFLYTFDEWKRELPLANLNSADDTIKAITNFLAGNYIHWLVSTKPDVWNISPLKTYNTFGAGHCDNNAQVFTSLMKYLGYADVSIREMGGEHHVVGVATLNGRTIPLDGDIEVTYPRRGTDSLATFAQLCSDQDLIRRQHHYGFAAPSFVLDNSVSLLYSDKLPFTDYAGGQEIDSVFLELLPAERIEFLFQRLPGRAHQFLHGYQQYANLVPDPPPTNRLGRQVYQPSINQDLCEYLRDTINITVANVNGTAVLSPAETTGVGSFVVKIQSPFVITDGAVRIRYYIDSTDTAASFAVSMSKYTPNDFRQIYSSEGRLAGLIEDTVGLFETIQPIGTPMMDTYFLKFEMKASRKGGMLLSDFNVVSDFQFNPNSVPRLRAGLNTVRIFDPAGNPLQGLTTSVSTRRIDSLGIPESSASPLFPRDGDTVATTMDVQFQWSVPPVRGQVIVSDYQIQVSERSDFAFPVSSAFNALASQSMTYSRTAAWTVPYPGMLLAGKKYYWRVAAKSRDGVWGEWSKPWSFLVEGPGEIVAPVVQDGGDSVRLSWKADPRGSAPVRYVVYGYSVSGSSLSDCTPIDSVATAEFTVKNNTRILAYPFYRIVAVDSKGRRSGMSQQIPMARPRVLFQPPGIAQAGRSVTINLQRVQPMYTFGDPVRTTVDSVAIAASSSLGHMSFDGTQLTGAVAASDTIIHVNAQSQQAGEDLSVDVRLNVNNQPRFTSPISYTLREDSAFTLRLQSIDPDGDSVSYRFLNLPPWIIGDSVVGILAGVPPATAVGKDTVQIQARDSRGGYAEQLLALQVVHTNHTPSIVGISRGTVVVVDTSQDVAAFEDARFSAKVACRDIDIPRFSDTLSWRLGQRPAWLSIDSTTSILSGIPRAPDVGRSVFEVIVQDNHGARTTRSFWLRVAHTNHAPMISAIPPVSFAEDSSTRLDLRPYVSDSDGPLQLIHWSVKCDSAIAGGSLALAFDTISSTIQFLPAHNFNGSHIPVFLKATDAEGASGYDTVTVTVFPVNDPPRFVRSDTVRIHESDSVVVPYSAFSSLVIDPDNADSTLRWSLSGGRHVGVASTGNGFRFRGERYWNGSEVLQLSVRDSAGLTDSTRLTVVVSPVDDPPVLAGVPNISFPEDSCYVLHLAPYLRDPDDSIANLRWAIALPDFQRMVDLSPGPATSPTDVPNTEPTAADSLYIQFDPARGFITFSPARNFACTGMRVVISASDSSNTTRDTIDVSVTPVNDPPIITCVADTFACLGVRYRFGITVTDPDDSTFGFLLKGPPWLHIDSTGTVQGVPAEAGEFPVTVVVFDLHRAADTLSYRLLVTVLKSVVDGDEGIPGDFILQQNYPNPFNPSTAVRFGLPERSRVSMMVYNMVGQHVEDVLMDEVEAGFHTISWRPSHLASGAYMIVLEGKSLVTPGRDVRIVKKALLLR